MKIALIDSGVDINHCDFVKAKIERIDLFMDKNIYDDNGHGTSSAGEILCVNPKAEIISIKILDKDNSTNLQVLVRALEYCLRRKDIGIINMSLTCRIDDAEIENALQSLIDRLVMRRVLIFCSEPNYGHEGKYIHNLRGVYAVRAEYDAHCDDCMIDRKKEQVIYTGSSFLRPSIQDEYRIFRGNSSYTARTSGVVSKVLTKGFDVNGNMQIKSGIVVEPLKTCHTLQIYEQFSDNHKLLDLLINPKLFLNSIQQIGFKHTVRMFDIGLPVNYSYSNVSLEHLKNPEYIIESIIGFKAR